MKKYLYYISILLLFISCDATKRVPAGSYLLNKVDIKTDTKSVSASELKPFLRQKPNSSMFLLGRVKLHAHNIPDNDSTWLSKMLLKYGEPPVLYSDRLAGVSIEQLRLQLANKGYLNAEVDTVVTKKDKLANVKYEIIGHEPYLVRNFKDTIASVDSVVYDILNDSKRLGILHKGDIYDQERLEKGRINMSTELRNNGYFNFSKDNFYYLVDSTLGTHQVDITLAMKNPTDTTQHKFYRFGDVIVHNGVSSSILQDSSKHHLLDTVEFNGIKVVSERTQFMRPRVIYYNTFIRPERTYSDRLVERTYSSLNKLGSISQTSIDLVPVEANDSNFINANISIFPGNMHHLQFGVGGTHSAGDLGVATDLSYVHKNFLKGGETFRIKLNGAYEFVPASDKSSLADKSYYEYGAEAFLSIPQLLLPWLMQRLKDQPSASTEFSVGMNFQNRQEYLRQFFNLSSRLQWSRNNWQVTNVVEPLAATYVRMPRVSEDFRKAFLNDSINPILKASYEEQMIVRSAYNITYTNVSPGGDAPRFPFRIRGGIEVAGYLPRLLSSTGLGKKNEAGRQMLFGIPYAEYVKADFDFAPYYRFDDWNTLAAHIALGVAVPYGNSFVLPFEKRYYGGGANSVRGWSTRTLGPGAYDNEQNRYDFANKTGDIKLDLSIEFRRKLTNLFELAGFVDAGNIWTIKKYVSQPGGYFELKNFYKDIALSYGVGLRIDLNFLLLRLDTGMKAYDPAMPAGEKWSLIRPNFSRDFALHFAIGYPF